MLNKNQNLAYFLLIALNLIEVTFINVFPYQDTYTALVLAAGNGHLEVVRVLIEGGAAIDTVGYRRGRRYFFM